MVALHCVVPCEALAVALMEYTFGIGAFPVDAKVDEEEEEKEGSRGDDDTKAEDQEEGGQHTGNFFKDEKDEGEANNRSASSINEEKQAAGLTGPGLPVDASEAVTVAAAPKGKAHTTLLHLAARHNMPALNASLLAVNADVTLKARVHSHILCLMGLWHRVVQQQMFCPRGTGAVGLSLSLAVRGFKGHAPLVTYCVGWVSPLSPKASPPPWKRRASMRSRTHLPPPLPTIEQHWTSPH